MLRAGGLWHDALQQTRQQGIQVVHPGQGSEFYLLLHSAVLSVYILRLAASNQTIRSARRSPAMATFLVREISLSTCLLKFLSVSQLSSFRTLHTFAIVLFIYSFLRSDGSPTSSQRFEQQIDKTPQTLAIIQNFRRDPLL